MYIYIFTNLLSTSIHGDKEKEKITPEFKDNNISDHCLGKKEKDYREKKRIGQLRHTSSKESRDMQSVGQKNKNPPQNAAMLQLQKVLNTKQSQLQDYLYTRIYIYIYIYICTFIYIYIYILYNLPTRTVHECLLKHEKM